MQKKKTVVAKEFHLRKKKTQPHLYLNGIRRTRHSQFSYTFVVLVVLT